MAIADVTLPNWLVSAAHQCLASSYGLPPSPVPSQAAPLAPRHTCQGHKGRVAALRMRNVLRLPGRATTRQPCAVLLMNTDVSVHFGALYDR